MMSGTFKDSFEKIIINNEERLVQVIPSDQIIFSSINNKSDEKSKVILKVKNLHKAPIFNFPIKEDKKSKLHIKTNIQQNRNVLMNVTLDEVQNVCNNSDSLIKDLETNNDDTLKSSTVKIKSFKFTPVLKKSYLLPESTDEERFDKIQLELKENLTWKIGNEAASFILKRFFASRKYRLRSCKQLLDFLKKFDMIKNKLEKKHQTQSNTTTNKVTQVINIVQQKSLCNIETQTDAVHLSNKKIIPEKDIEDECLSDSITDLDPLIREYNSDESIFDTIDTGKHKTDLFNMKESVGKNKKSEPSIVENDLSVISSYEKMSSFTMVLRLYKDWMHCNLPDTSGYLPIHKTILQNDLGAVKCQIMLLKKKNLNVNITNRINSMTPLHFALLNNAKLDIISELLKNDANPELQDIDGNTSIHFAVQYTSVQHLNEIITFNYPYKLNLDIHNFEGLTPLMLCAQNNEAEAALLLIKCRANLDVQDLKSGRTALFHAIENNSDSVVKMLIEAGTNTKIKTLSGVSVWEAATEISDLSSDIINILHEFNIIPSNSKKKRKCDTNTRIVKCGKKRILSNEVHVSEDSSSFD